MLKKRLRGQGPLRSGAGFLGSSPGEHISVTDIVGIALTPDDGGYYMAAADGRVYAFGNAQAGPQPAVTSDPGTAAYQGQDRLLGSVVWAWFGRGLGYRWVLQVNARKRGRTCLYEEGLPRTSYQDLRVLPRFRAKNARKRGEARLLRGFDVRRCGRTHSSAGQSFRTSSRQSACGARARRDESDAGARAPVPLRA
jgi:hypothetical protein